MVKTGRDLEIKVEGHGIAVTPGPLIECNTISIAGVCDSCDRLDSYFDINIEFGSSTPITNTSHKPDAIWITCDGHKTMIPLHNVKSVVYVSEEV